MITFEQIVQTAALAIQSVWEAEWRRADFFHELTKVYGKKEIKAVMEQLGRSHQDAYRWATLSKEFPIETRAQDRSPREHVRIANQRGKRANSNDHLA